MKRLTLTLIAMTAVGLTLAGSAYAQGSHEEHHPGGAAADTAQAKKMPMEKGMKPSDMPGGMKGNGKMEEGQMGPGMMGKGMMKGGMMGKGMMGRMGQGGMMGRNCPMMGSGDGETHAAGRIAFIKAELGIKEDQKAAFEGFAGALKENLQDMHAMRSSMMAGMKPGTPVERLSAHIQMMEGRLETLKGVRPALDRLYSVLSDEQKKKADKILTGMGCMM